MRRQVLPMLALAALSVATAPAASAGSALPEEARIVRTAAPRVLASRSMQSRSVPSSSLALRDGRHPDRGATWCPPAPGCTTRPECRPQFQPGGTTVVVAGPGSTVVVTTPPQALSCGCASLHGCTHRTRARGFHPREHQAQVRADGTVRIIR